MASINVTADINQAVNEFKKFNDILDLQNQRLKDVTVTSAQYNQAGVRVRSTIQGWTTDTQKFVATTQLLRNGTERLNFTFTDSKKKIEAYKAALNDLNRGLSDITRSAQFFATYNFFALFTQGIKDGFNAARDLQIQISLIRTISQDAQRSFSLFGKDIVEVSNRTGQAIEDVGKAFFDTASNQIAKGANIKAFVDEATNLAKTTGGTVTDAVNLLSSAINAYGQPVTEARNLSALFFKTIDEGRVVLGEMANVFGRVAVQGRAVGVSINDLSATVAFLTKQGVLTSDAFTFVTNLFTQLQKPSRELQAFFKSIGSKDGIQAIATFGFVGLLEKLTSEVKAGNAAATDFFKEIRAEKPFEAISNNFDDFKRVTREFQDVKKLATTFNEAIKIRLESPAAQLEIEFNKIRNFFVNDVGQSVVALVAQIIQGFGQINKIFGGGSDFIPALNLMVRLFRDGVIAVIAFRTAMAANTAITLAYSSAATAAGTSTLTLGQRLAVVGGGLRALVPGLLGVAAALAALELASKNDFLDKGVEKFGEIEAEIKKVRNEAQALGAVVSEDPNKKFIEAAQPRFQGALQALSKAQVENDKQLAKIRQQNIATATEIGNTFKIYTDSINRGINSLKSQITDAQQIIESSRKSLLGFRDTVDSLLLDTRLQFATDEQKTFILQNRIQELIAKSKEFVGSQDNAKIQEGIQFLEEAAKLTKDRFIIQQNLNADPLVSTRRLEQDLNDILRTRQDLQGQIERSKNKEIELTQKQVDLEKKRLLDVESAFKEFNKFSAFDAGGGIDPRFKDTVTGRVKVEQVKVEFEKLSAALVDAAGKDITTRVGLEQLLAQRKKDILAELSATERADAIELSKTKIALAKRELEEKLSALRKEFEEKALLNKEIQKKLESQLADLSGLKNVADTIATGTVDFRKILPKFIERQLPDDELQKGFKGDPKKLADAFKAEGQIDAALKKYEASLKLLKDNARDVSGVLVPRDEDIRAVESAIQAVIKNIRIAYAPVAQSFGVPVNQLTFPGTNVTILEYEKAINLIIDKLKGNLADINKNVNQQQRVKADALINLFPGLDAVTEKFGTIDSAAEITKQKLKTNFSEISTSINGASAALQNFFNLLKQVPGIGGGQEIGADLGGEQFFASGGIVGFPGRPRGKDRYPIWAAKGEMIINAESTAQFKDVLMWINNQRTPQYMNRGGITGDTVSIGDINITVNDSGSPNATALATGKHLERQLRRNNIRLNRRK